MTYSPAPFAQKHLLRLQDYSEQEILHILSFAAHLKEKAKRGEKTPILAGKTLAMIFAKSSTRTRISFEVGMLQLGGNALFLNQNDIQLGRGETVADTARVLSRYVDGIMIRTFAQKDVADLAHYGSIPVINGLTDDYHPCQALADLLTIYEHKKALKGLKVAFIGDGNNVAASLSAGCTALGMHFAIASPSGYEMAAESRAFAEASAKKTGASTLFTQDPFAAAEGADVIYTDVFVSMGQEKEKQARLATFANYQVNAKLMQAAAKGAIFMHCLPAHRGEEVSEEVLESSASVIFDEAENRLHAQKAVMALLMGSEVSA